MEARRSIFRFSHPTVTIDFKDEHLKITGEDTDEISLYYQHLKDAIDYCGKLGLNQHPAFHSGSGETMEIIIQPEFYTDNTGVVHEGLLGLTERIYHQDFEHIVANCEINFYKPAYELTIQKLQATNMFSPGISPRDVLSLRTVVFHEYFHALHYSYRIEDLYEKQWYNLMIKPPEQGGPPFPPPPAAAALSRDVVRIFESLAVFF